MYLDKVPIEGGQTKDTAVIIGKDYLVPGFDKKIIGAKKGDTREFSLPYPKEHYMKNIAGKMVEFKVEVKEVYSREIPKLDDELAKSSGEYENLGALKEGIEKRYGEISDVRVRSIYYEEIMLKLANNSKFEIPESMISALEEDYFVSFQENIKKRGTSEESYFEKFTSKKDLKKKYHEEAIKYIKRELILNDIIQNEKLSVTEKDIEEYTNRIYPEITDKDKKSILKKERDYLLKTVLDEKISDFFRANAGFSGKTKLKFEELEKKYNELREA